MRKEWLRAEGEPDLLRFTTAGSVDDGKSTLIGRLLHDADALYEDHLEALRKAAGQAGAELDFSLVTDGLRAEREQSITIDVAYRYFATPRRRFIVADTPGHEQYTRNMATGASTADLAVILIDARLGVLGQSRRHGFIASLLGVPRVVVAVNKMDLVDYRQDAFDAIRRDYETFAARLGFSDLTFIPVSALRGDNVVAGSARMPWYPGPCLLSHLESVYIGGDANLIDFRFPVQRVARPDQDFRGYSGQVASGVVRRGDEIVVLPSGQRSRVERIVTFDGELDYAFPPLAVTLCLADHIDIGRGDLLAHPNNVPRMQRTVEAMVVWMDDEPLEAGRTYLVKHTATTVKASCIAVVYRVDPDSLHRHEAARLQRNDIARVRLSLFKSIPVDEYRKNRATGSLILIDPVTNATAGAGMIIDRPSAPTAGLPEARASLHLAWQPGKVSRAQRTRLLGHEPLTVWMTGLSGSGKSTLAFELERRLIGAGRACYVLDGDNIRRGLSRDLGFSPGDRRENLRRVAETARLMNDAGMIVITALISPYREDREMARSIVGAEQFCEVFLDADVDTCERRDSKGLYAKARAGKVVEFTGISAPYEPPPAPELVLATGSSSVEECVGRLLEVVTARIG